MKPIMQTTLVADPDWHAKGLVPGNCHQAAVASLTEKPLDEVPHFSAAPPEPGIPEGWTTTRDARKWARSALELDFTWTTPDDEATLTVLRDEARGRDDLFAIAVGRTRRGPYLHSVVWDLVTWTCAHDPHPDGSGLTELIHIEWLTDPYDPDPDEQVALWLAEEQVS